MKNIYKTIFLLFLTVSMVSCGLDNFEEPKSQLSGQVEYEGQPVRLKGTLGAIQLQLYQDGFDFKNPIAVFVDQDGKFEATLFDGTYKLVTRDNNGPWVNSRDTTIVEVKGNTSIKFGVTPFFTISNAKVSLSGNKLTGSCDVTKIVNTAELSYVRIYVNGTSFVDESTNLFSVNAENETTGNVSFDYNLSELGENQKNQYDKFKGVYARVAVRAKGIDQAIYSEVFKIK